MFSAGQLGKDGDEVKRKETEGEMSQCQALWQRLPGQLIWRHEKYEYWGQFWVLSNKEGDGGGQFSAEKSRVLESNPNWKVEQQMNVLVLYTGINMHVFRKNMLVECDVIGAISGIKGVLLGSDTWDLFSGKFIIETDNSDNY